MKIKKSDLRKVLRGEMTIQEAKVRALRSLKEASEFGLLITEEVPSISATNPTMFENDSLDSQVDRFLMQGESNKAQEEMGNPATPTPSPETATEGYYRMDMDALLMEAPGDPPAAAGGAPPPPIDATPAPDAGTDTPAEPPPQQPEQKGNKELDALTFADNVARLVEKHESLLDIRGTIVRRALNWVTKNYDAKQSKEVKQILEGNFGITPDNANDSYEDDMAPPAKGAGSGLNT